MASLMLVNPRPRRKARKARKKSPFKRHRASLSTVKTTTRRYRRNPSGRGKMMQTVTQGAIGAAGALAVDVAMQKMPFIPDNLKTGTLAPVTRGMVGIGLGMLVAKVGKNARLGKQLADGAVTVSLYSAGKNLIGPQLGLADGELLGDDSLLYYGEDSMSSMESDLGWTNAAETFEFEEEDSY